MHHTLLRHHIGFALNVVALGLFFPGILLPIFALSTDMLASLGPSDLSASLVNKELSIMATVRELWDDQRLLVAALIFVFSVCIPVLKSLLLTVAYVARRSAAALPLARFVSAIGKWSMADVFVVAVFLAVLSTSHAETQATHEFVIFGFRVALDVSTQTLSMVGEGFYYFTAYCLLSIFGAQLALSGLKRLAPAPSV